MDIDILVNQKKLHIKLCGDVSKPPLLFIHGVPGLGSMDFMYFQQKKLSKYFFVIAPDQRGVWASDPLDEKEPYSINQIISDYECIRKHFNIKQWSCVSHSFGARILTEYLTQYPKSIDKIIFESPILDLRTPLIEILKVQLAILNKKKIDIKPVVEKIISAKTISQLKKIMFQMERETGVTSNGITMSKKTLQGLTKLRNSFESSLFMNSRRTEIKASDDYSLFSVNFQKYHFNNKSALFIKGSNDPTVPLNSLSIYKNLFLKSEVCIVKNAKHWVHIDAPSYFYRTVCEYML